MNKPSNIEDRTLHNRRYENFKSYIEIEILGEIPKETNCTFMNTNLEVSANKMLRKTFDPRKDEISEQCRILCNRGLRITTKSWLVAEFW
jgi:hypothetical protein